jgi:hypothetical protein
MDFTSWQKTIGSAQVTDNVNTNTGPLTERYQQQKGMLDVEVLL